MYLKKELAQQAYKDFIELNEKVSKSKKTLLELCEEYNGYNYDEDIKMFDCHYGILDCTIAVCGSGFYVCRNVDIIDNYKIIKRDFDIFKI